MAQNRGGRGWALVPGCTVDKQWGGGSQLQTSLNDRAAPMASMRADGVGSAA